MADVQATIEGMLHVRRVQNRRRSKYLLDNLVLDSIAPRYYREVSAYVTAGELVGTRHEVVVGLRGKILRELSLEDDGKPVRISGSVRWNVHAIGKLGSMRRVKVTFLVPDET